MIDLNPREIAILVWLGVGLTFCVFHPGIRSALSGVLKAAKQPLLLMGFGVLYIYVGLVIWLLDTLSLWDWDQLKNVFVWSIFVGIASLFRLPSIGEDSPFFRDWFKDNLKVIAVFEFIVTFHSFPLAVELVLQPLVMLVFALLAVAGTQERYRPVKRFLDGLVTAFGVVAIGYAIYMLAADFHSFATWTTLRDFYVPIVMSLALLPLLFAFHVYMTYERIFSVLRFHIKDVSLLRYTKFRSLISFGPSTTMLRRWHRYIGAHRPKSARQTVSSATRDRRG